MNKPQERRSINLSTEVYQQLSFLQAEVRLLMRDTDYVLSKTAMTNILEALVKNTSAKEMVELLDR